MNFTDAVGFCETQGGNLAALPENYDAVIGATVMKVRLVHLLTDAHREAWFCQSCVRCRVSGHAYPTQFMREFFHDFFLDG